MVCDFYILCFNITTKHSVTQVCCELTAKIHLRNSTRIKISFPGMLLEQRPIASCQGCDGIMQTPFS